MTTAAEPVSVTAAFARRVRDLRAENGWSREGTASRAGISLSMIRRIERGDNTTLATADKVAAAFGKPLSELVAPVSCGQCFDSPEPGFACLECGAKGREPS